MSHTMESYLQKVSPQVLPRNHKLQMDMTYGNEHKDFVTSVLNLLLAHEMVFLHSKPGGQRHQSPENKEVIVLNQKNLHQPSIVLSIYIMSKA